jgi:hypothetical protein
VTVASLFFQAKYIFVIILYPQIIEYFRLKIDDLRNAINCKIISSERRSKATSANRQLSIFDLQFLLFVSGLPGLGPHPYNPCYPWYIAGILPYFKIAFHETSNLHAAATALHAVAPSL